MENSDGLREGKISDAENKSDNNRGLDILKAENRNENMNLNGIVKRTRLPQSIQL